MKATRIAFCVLFLCLCNSILVAGHSKLKCPTPMSTDTGIKTGPCGSDLDGDVTVLQPGVNTIMWEEEIVHAGAPYRIALSISDTTLYFEDSVLLDHIPHNDNPTVYEGNLAQYRHNIVIPDINCTNCALQLVNFMTDKIADGSYCTYHADCTTCSTSGYCFSNYHSCAKIQINGTQDPATWLAGYTYTPPSDWPFTSTPGYYTQEPGTWEDAWLVNLDDTPQGVCGEKINDGRSSHGNMLMAPIAAITLATLMLL